MLKKTAIAISPELLSEVDRAAKALGRTRNAFIGLVLSKAVQARRDREITRKLDELFADPELARAQLGEQTSLDATDEWSNERW